MLIEYAITLMTSLVISTNCNYFVACYFDQHFMEQRKEKRPNIHTHTHTHKNGIHNVTTVHNTLHGSHKILRTVKKSWAKNLIVGWWFGFYGTSTFVAYLTLNFYANSQFYFKQFSLIWVNCLIVKTFLFQTIQFIQTVLIHLIQFV